MRRKVPPGNATVGLHNKATHSIIPYTPQQASRVVTRVCAPSSKDSFVKSMRARNSRLAKNRTAWRLGSFIQHDAGD